MPQTPYESDENYFGHSPTDFADNPEPRVPCVLLLDVSSSMGGAPIDELNDGLTAFKDELLADSLATKRVEPAIITFGNRVEVAADFVTADAFDPPVLTVSGSTPMGEAVNRALDLIAERKRLYQDHGISYYRPWIFLITDGGPTDGTIWQSAAKRAREEQARKAITFFAVGVAGANMDVLKEFTVKPPLTLKGLKFRELFAWLSASLKSVSRSSPGDDVHLEDPTGPGGWGRVEA